MDVEIIKSYLKEMSKTISGIINDSDINIPDSQYGMIDVFKYLIKNNYINGQIEKYEDGSFSHISDFKITTKGKNLINGIE